MEEKLIKILEKGYEAAMKTGEFVIQEGTILVQQFLQWKVFEHSLWIIIGLLFLVGTPVIIRKIFKRRDDGCMYSASWFWKPINYDWDDGEFFGATLATVCSMIIGFIVFIVNVFYLIKLMVAPNVYLLEYILQRM